MNAAISTFDQAHCPPARTRSRDSGSTPKKCDVKNRFNRLVMPLQTDLSRYTTWLCRDADLSQDVVQETLLRAWRGLDSLQDESLTKQWLFTIARREHARHFERKKLTLKDIDDLTGDEELQATVCDDSELEEVRQKIMSLRTSYREPLVLQVLLGFNMKEIAGLLGISVSAVGVRLHRARLALAKSVCGDEAADLLDAKEGKTTA